MRRTFRRKFRKAEPIKEFPRNERIMAMEVFVIDENGNSLGVMRKDAAIARAREAGMDLIAVAPHQNPPVAKILDYGKFKYQQEKQEQKQKLKTKKTEVKGIRLSFLMARHDIEMRAEQAKEFLSNGDKLKVEMILRGREHQHTGKAREMLNEFIGLFGNELQITVEQPIVKQGRALTMILSAKTAS